jgi:hypothetical protein
VEPQISLTASQRHVKKITVPEKFYNNQGPIFCTFFLGKIPQKNIPPKMLGKVAIFREKSFEESFFQQIPGNFPRKITFLGKTFTKNWPQFFGSPSIQAQRAILNFTPGPQG